VLGLGAWWVIERLDSKNELTAAKWRPFTTGDVWSNFLIPGLEGTLKAAALSMIIALPAGGALALARLSQHRWIRWPAAAVVEFFRAIPVLLLMFFAQSMYFTYTDVSPDDVPLYSVVTGLVLYNASVLCEVFRAGVLALPIGQTEAALAIGLSKPQTMLRILLPQAVAAMLPAIVSQLVVVLKDTALGGQLVGYIDLMRQATTLSANFSNAVATYVVIGLIYVAVNFLLSALAGQLERWLRRRQTGRGRAVIAVPLPGGLAGGAPPGGAMGPPALPHPPETADRR
jgi:glutamate transport system permease protein